MCDGVTSEIVFHCLHLEFVIKRVVFEIVVCDINATIVLKCCELEMLVNRRNTELVSYSLLSKLSLIAFGSEIL